MNLSNMARICGGDPEGKCSLLLAHAGQSGDVADPWYTGDFEATWQDVNIGCRALLERVNGKKSKNENSKRFMLHMDPLRRGKPAMMRLLFYCFIERMFR